MCFKDFLGSISLFFIHTMNNNCVTMAIHSNIFEKFKKFSLFGIIQHGLMAIELIYVSTRESSD